MIIWCYHYHYFKVYLYHQPVYQDTIYAGSEIVINENVCKPIYLNDLQNNLKSFLSQFFVAESTHNVLHKWHVSKGRMSPSSLPFSLEFGNFWFSSIHGFFTEILGQAFFLPGLVELTVGYVICSFFFFLTWISWTAIHWMSRKSKKSGSSLCGCPVTLDPAGESEDTSMSAFNKQRLKLSSEVNIDSQEIKDLSFLRGLYIIHPHQTMPSSFQSHTQWCVGAVNCGAWGREQPCLSHEAPCSLMHESVPEWFISVDGVNFMQTNSSKGEHNKS